jgi:hypothetical protein
MPLEALVEHLLATSLEVARRIDEPVATTTKARILSKIERTTSVTAGAKLRLMAGAADVAAQSGDRDVATWLSRATKTDLKTAQAQQHLARELAEECPEVGDALRAGKVNPDHAKVIVKSIQNIPSDVPDAIKERAQERLIEHAKKLAPKDLAQKGKGILDEVAPELEADQLAKEVLSEEQFARKATRLRLTPMNDGTHRLEGIVPNLTAHRLEAMLDGLTSPRQPDIKSSNPWVDESGDKIGYEHRLGLALVALLERVDVTKLPQHGNNNTALVVTVTREELSKELGVAEIIGSDDLLSTAEMTRLACNAFILAAVLDSTGEVLQYGRARRFFSAKQLQAMAVRDRHCRARGCKEPPARCEGHHKDPWSRGGLTDIEDGALLCFFHHHLIHDPAYEHAWNPDGTVTMWLRGQVRPHDPADSCQRSNSDDAPLMSASVLGVWDSPDDVGVPSDWAASGSAASGSAASGSAASGSGSLVGSGSSAGSSALDSSSLGSSAAGSTSLVGSDSGSE